MVQKVFLNDIRVMADSRRDVICDANMQFANRLGMCVVEGEWRKKSVANLKLSTGPIPNCELMIWRAVYDSPPSMSHFSFFVAPPLVVLDKFNEVERAFVHCCLWRETGQYENYMVAGTRREGWWIIAQWGERLITLDEIKEKIRQSSNSSFFAAYKKYCDEHDALVGRITQEA